MNIYNVTYTKELPNGEISSFATVVEANSVAWAIRRDEVIGLNITSVTFVKVKPEDYNHLTLNGLKTTIKLRDFRINELQNDLGTERAEAARLRALCMDTN